MSIAAEKRFALDRMNSTSIKLGLGSELHKCKNHVRGIWDFSKDGGAIGSTNILDTDGNAIVLPLGAIVMNVISDTLTAVTTSASGTIGLTGNSAADLHAATAAASMSGLVAGVPVGTAASAVKMTADRTLKAVIATGALTAGKVAFLVSYVLSE